MIVTASLVQSAATGAYSLWAYVYQSSVSHSSIMMKMIAEIQQVQAYQDLRLAALMNATSAAITNHTCDFSMPPCDPRILPPPNPV